MQFPLWATRHADDRDYQKVLMPRNGQQATPKTHLKLGSSSHTYIVSVPWYSTLDTPRNRIAHQASSLSDKPAHRCWSLIILMGWVLWLQSASLQEQKQQQNSLLGKNLIQNDARALTQLEAFPGGRVAIFGRLQITYATT